MKTRDEEGHDGNSEGVKRGGAFSFLFTPVFLFKALAYVFTAQV